jgi:hypothetical protein
MHALSLVAIWTALAVQPPADSSWAAQLFPERNIDLGTVARGSKIRHSFKLVNRTDHEIHIAAHKAKCGCTDVHLGASDIPPGTQTVIEATLDTNKAKADGYKPSGLTLIIDRPRYAEVDLNLSCFIRGDVTLNPGQLEFGAVQRTAGKSIAVTLSYVGTMPNWGIVKSQHTSHHLAARVQEQSRSADGHVQYTVTASLKPTVSPGIFKDVIRLETNDPSVQTIPISVTANVQSAVAVAPSILSLGSVKPGAVITKRVHIRSVQGQPFKVASLKSTRDALTATSDQDAKALHVVDLAFKAPQEPGPFHAVVEITSDIADEPPAKVSTFAHVVP